MGSEDKRVLFVRADSEDISTEDFCSVITEAGYNVVKVRTAMETKDYVADPRNRGVKIIVHCQIDPDRGDISERQVGQLEKALANELVEADHNVYLRGHHIDEYLVDLDPIVIFIDYASIPSDVLLLLR